MSAALLQSRCGVGAVERQHHLLERLDDALDKHAGALEKLSELAGEPCTLDAGWEADCDGYYLDWRVLDARGCQWGHGTDPDLAVQHALEALS